MNFRYWLEHEDEDKAQKDAELYFSIGHGGDDDDDDYIVWAYINGKIQTATSGTHGSNWGHSVTDRDFKGRYEPTTGRLSIVKPERLRYYGIPSTLMQSLHQKFKYITDVHEF